MRKVDVNLTRETIKLKIKKLMKQSVLDESPLLVDFFVNTIISQSFGVKNLLLAEAGELDKDYYPVGTVVQFPFKRTGEYYSTSRRDKMEQNPDDYGLKGEFLQGIIVDVYPFSSKHDYTVLYKGLNYHDEPEDGLVELEISDVKIYEYE
jgi:hypothetical protein